MASENVRLTGEPRIVKGEQKPGNQNEPKNCRDRKVFPLSREMNTEGIRIKHMDPLGPSVEARLLPGNDSNKSSSFVFLVVFTFFFFLSCSKNENKTKKQNIKI